MILDDKIKRIKQKIEKYKLELFPPIDKRKIIEFEETLGISLPTGYRRFLIEIGERAKNFQDELLPFKNLKDVRNKENILNADKEFPYKEITIWELEETGDKSLDEGLELFYNPNDLRNRNNGNIIIGDAGCGTYWLLVTKGPFKGEIWMIGVTLIQPCIPNINFLGWYEMWLDCRDTYPEFWDGLKDRVAKKVAEMDKK